MKKTLLFCALILISISSCKKDLKPIEPVKNNNTENVTISSDEIINWFVANPLVKPSQLMLDAGRQKVVNGDPVVRFRISSKSDLYFTKEKGLLKAYAYKWDDKTPGADKFTGNIYVYNFQTQTLEQLVYKSDILSGFGHLLTIEKDETPNTVKSKQRVNLWIPFISEIWCWITGGHVATSMWNVPPQCNYQDDLGGSDGGGGGGGPPPSLAGYISMGYYIVDASGSGGYGGGGSGGNGGGAAWGPPPPPCDPAYSPTNNGATRLKVNGNIGLGCPPLEDGQWEPYTIAMQVADDYWDGIDSVDPDDPWWDDSTLSFTAQTLPSYATLMANFPVDANGNEIPGPTVYANVGGAVYNIYLSSGNPNACALRLSIALNKSGITIPNISGQTFQGADGKYYFLSSSKIYNFMRKTFGEPTIKLSQADGGVGGSKFESKLGNNRGIFIMRVNSPTLFGAYGHATIYNGWGCVGGIDHCYFHAPGGVSQVALWKTN
jgi:hypothetical protein